jgi:uncharacterized membrane protein YozB (DUF420 family)
MNTFVKKNPTLVSIILFLTIFIVIQIAKPSFLYNNNGSIRPFGIGYRNKTIFPIWLLSMILGILCYLFVIYYIYNPKLI